MKRAIALFSGGLDSLLAIKLVKDQGIYVEALNIKIGFSSSDNSLKSLGITPRSIILTLL
jgi:tRNA-specific 2-thiouridylase